MAAQARVDSIDALRAVRAAVLRFVEAADRATVEADAEIERTLHWLRREQPAYWRAQVRRRTDAVRNAKDALSRKRMSFTATGRQPSTVDEEKALAAAQRRLEEAEQKLQAVKAWAQQVDKERFVYRAAAAPVRRLIERDLPKAVGELDVMLASLEAYVSLAPSEAAAEAQAAGAESRRPPARAESEADAEPPAPQQDEADEHDEPEDEQR